MSDQWEIVNVPWEDLSKRFRTATAMVRILKCKNSKIYTNISYYFSPIHMQVTAHASRHSLHNCSEVTVMGKNITPARPDTIAVGSTVLFLALCVWQSGLVQFFTLHLIRIAAKIIPLKRLSLMVLELPRNVVLRTDSLYEPHFLVVAILTTLCGVWLFKFLSDDYTVRWREAEWRMHLSAISGFCMLLVMMTLSFINLVGGVLVSGQTIKPFPRAIIGAEQYLNILSYLPWALALATALFLIFELLHCIRGAVSKSGLNS